MKMIKKTVKVALAFILMSSAVFAQGSLSDAKKAIDAEQYQKAKDILKKLIAAKPADAENYFFLGNVYVQGEYLDSAKTTYNSGVTADAGSPLNYIGLGALDLEAGNAAAAKANFDKAAGMAKKKDSAPLLYIGKAYTWSAHPDYAQALVYLDKAALANPKDFEVPLAKGDAFRGRNQGSDLSSAYSAYTDAIMGDPNLIRAKLELAIINMRTNSFKEASDAFDAIVASNANYGPVYRAIAENHWKWAVYDAVPQREGHYAKAVQAYEKYLDLTDRSLESRLRYADFLVYAHDYKALEKEATALAAAGGSNPRVYRYLGIAAYNNGNYAQAEKSLDDWFAKTANDPKRVAAVDYLYRGRAKVKNQKIDEGFKDLAQAIKLDSTNIDAVTDDAKAFYDAKDWLSAAKAYEIATHTSSISKKASASVQMGLANYQYFITKYSKDTTATRAEGLPYLAKADSAFSYVLTLDKDNEQIMYLRTGIAALKDDPKKKEGTFIPAYESYLAAIGSKNPMSPTEKAHVLAALKKVGYYYYEKFDPNGVPADQLALLAKSKEYYTKVLAIDPADAYSNQIIPAIDKVVAQLNAPAKAPAKKN
jgi:predicted Zn-dependent protease